jgi:ferredoxin-NADP reductase
VNVNFSNAGSSFIPLIIENIREETKGFKTFSFAEGHDLEYQAGQFITLVDYNRSQEIRRSYSIISSPALKEPLSIAVKRIDNGVFSRKLVDRARIGGSGIAPVLSLIKTVIHLYPDISVYLIYSNQSIETTAFYHELQKLAWHHPGQLHIDFLFSSESDLRKARLNRDLLLEFFKIKYFDREKTLFYTCGPESYMRMIIFHLVEEGFSLNQIKKEDFNPGNKKLTGRFPPDKSSYHVDLDLKGSKFSFPVKYPDSILQAAKKIKLNLPYSCETGKCGSCAAICTKGKVWLSNNEVLTDKELALGLTLTCTGHPQEGDVILKIE